VFPSVKVGSKLKMMYDMGSTTRFVMTVTAVDVAPSPALLAALPRMIQPPDATPAGYAPHQPPPGTPRLDDVFPHLSALIFDSATNCVLLFPHAPSGCIAIEAVRCWTSFLMKRSTGNTHTYTTADQTTHTTHEHIASNGATTLNSRTSFIWGVR